MNIQLRHNGRSLFYIIIAYNSIAIDVLTKIIKKNDRHAAINTTPFVFGE